MNISADEIKEAAESGTLNDLYEEGLCQYCGSCREDITNILKDLIQDTEEDYYR